MTDTQWPRYEVFKQDRPGRPHESIGTVHAVDAEMALQNARDLFARRPKCYSLWVARADAIYSKTVEELAVDDTWQETIDLQAADETYLVFQKQTERRGMAFTIHVGEVEASSPEQALQKALERFPAKELFVWWVCPKTAVTASEEEDIASMFIPPTQKEYRMPNQYRTVFTMQKIRRETEQDFG